MTMEAVQVQVTQKCMLIVGMASQTLIWRVRGSWNMHWPMTCSSVTHSTRNIKVIPLHIGHVIKQPIYIDFMLFQKSMCDVISKDVVALQHQLQVNNILIGMLPRSSSNSISLPVQKCRNGTRSNGWRQIFIVWNYKGKGDNLDRRNYRGLKGDALEAPFEV